MKKIIYFSYPTESGGVIFQNGCLNIDNRYRLSEVTDGLVRSQGRPEVNSFYLFLQGHGKQRDLDFQISKSKPDYYDKAIDLINKINNGDINV